MSHEPPARTTAERLDPALVMSVLRASVGVLAWTAPAASWRAFGLGPMPTGSAAVATRLFAARELALALASAHPATREPALRAGVVVDAADTVAGIVGARRGAPRAALVGVSLGAATFVGLGLAALGRGRTV